jgi:hypothetical protein
LCPAAHINFASAEVAVSGEPRCQERRETASTTDDVSRTGELSRHYSPIRLSFAAARPFLSHTPEERRHITPASLRRSDALVDKPLLKEGRAVDLPQKRPGQPLPSFAPHTGCCRTMSIVRRVAAAEGATTLPNSIFDVTSGTGERACIFQHRTAVISTGPFKSHHLYSLRDTIIVALPFPARLRPPQLKAWLALAS